VTSEKYTQDYAWILLNFFCKVGWLYKFCGLCPSNGARQPMTVMTELSLAQHFITGFESTYMPGIGTDVLAGTRHNERFRDDFALIKALGIKTIRYPAAWNYVQQDKNRFDWSWLDEKLAVLQELDLIPILDLVHHTAIPDHIFPDGFASVDFPERLQEFAWQCASRYPWITQYTVFNEPYLTVQFCGEFGIWFPFHSGGHSFVTMLLNITRGIVKATRTLRLLQENIQILHTDTCERHVALDPTNAAASNGAAFANARRFLVDDLLHGGVTLEHPLYSYLIENGATESQLRWFQENIAPPNIRGLDYYRQSEWEWLDGAEKQWAERRAGFASVAGDYVERYHLPVMLSETNYFGSVAERTHWLRFMWQEYRTLLQDGKDVRGFCWFPFIDSTDFQHMLLEYRNDVDPVGIYDLDEARWERIPTALVSIIAQLADESEKA
jgi:beta-glucosidase/6-phospho-beta-glucosidase/beta-galactosidase